MRTIDELRRLEEALGISPLPRADQQWSGADVIITGVAPAPPAEGSFYPEPLYVVTEYSLELTWLFERLRDAFYAEERLDGNSKIEFFGRLAVAANTCLEREPAARARDICAAVLHEAFVM